MEENLPRNESLGPINEPENPMSEIDRKGSSFMDAKEVAVQNETMEENLHRNESLGPINEPENPMSEIDRKGSSFMDAKETEEPNVESTDEVENKSKINQDIIENAIQKRSTYFQENAGSVTMSEVRRLLEDDLKLADKSLDSHKAFIKKKIEEILTTEVAEPKKDVKKKSTLGVNRSKRKKISATKNRGNDSGDLSSQNESHSDSEKNEKGSKPKKRTAKEIKAQDPKMPKWQKISAKESKPSISARKKPTESITTKDSDDNSKENAYEDDDSHSSVVKSPKKKENHTAPSYGKKVEVLKKLIKSCGMGVPPTVYKRAKQAPENEREASLIKELEGILDREGLSKKSSEKEIKAVRKKKEKAKELEGIDMSNIVSSSRRRTTSNFIPSKPKSPVLSDESGEEEEDDDDEGDNSDDGNSNGVSSEGSEDDADESD